MRKRAFIIILAFPVLALLWLIGWFSYRVGSRSSQSSSRNEETTIMEKENLSEPMEIIAPIDEDLLTAIEED